MIHELIKEYEDLRHQYILGLYDTYDHDELLKLSGRIYSIHTVLDNLRGLVPEEDTSVEDYKKVVNLANKYSAEYAELLTENTKLKADNLTLQLFIEDNVSDEKKLEVFKN